MPIDVSWYIPNKIIRAHFYDYSGIEEIQELGFELGEHIQEGIAPVHILLDDATAQPPPINLQQLKMTLNFERNHIDKLGWVIGFGDVNMVAKMVLPPLMKVLRMNYSRVATIEEAIIFLQKQDKSLQIITEI